MKRNYEKKKAVKEHVKNIRGLKDKQQKENKIDEKNMKK